MSKILITVTGSWGTGSFTHAKAVIDKFIALGHTVKLFFPDNKDSREDVFKYFQNVDLCEIWEFPIQNEKAKIEYFLLRAC